VELEAIFVGAPSWRDFLNQEEEIPDRFLACATE
jgi:hypothetical protein